MKASAHHKTKRDAAELNACANAKELDVRARQGHATTARISHVGAVSQRVRLVPGGAIELLPDHLGRQTSPLIRLPLCVGPRRVLGDSDAHPTDAAHPTRTITKRSHGAANNNQQFRYVAPIFGSAAISTSLTRDPCHFNCRQKYVPRLFPYGSRPISCSRDNFFNVRFLMVSRRLGKSVIRDLLPAVIRAWPIPVPPTGSAPVLGAAVEATVDRHRRMSWIAVKIRCHAATRQ